MGIGLEVQLDPIAQHDRAANLPAPGGHRQTPAPLSRKRVNRPLQGGATVAVTTVAPEQEAKVGAPGTEYRRSQLRDNAIRTARSRRLCVTGARDTDPCGNAGDGKLREELSSRGGGHIRHGGPGRWAGDGLRQSHQRLGSTQFVRLENKIQLPVPLPAAEPAASARVAERTDSHALPVRVLQFGTGVLLRALVTPAVHRANLAGRRAGRVALVQSTRSGLATQLAEQHGRYSLLVRGSRAGEVIDEVSEIDAFAVAWHVEDDWAALCQAVGAPELQVVVSNVTEAGFQLDPADARRVAAGERPSSYPGRLAALLLARRRALRDDAPPLLIIPTELVDDNGTRLRELVVDALAECADTEAIALWCRQHVRFASSLVDRITTAAPSGAPREALMARLGRDDPLLAVTEPYALWAIEGDPKELRQLLPIDDPATGIIFARDIGPLRDRKLRLLNGAHTAMAPIAFLAGIITVRETVHDAVFGLALRRLLFDELVPHAAVPLDDAKAFAHDVLDRFANPWIEHAWTTILGSHGTKLRNRLGPVLREAAASRRPVPMLALAVAATALVAQRAPFDPTLEPLATQLAVGDPETAFANALDQSDLWGATLTAIPGFESLARTLYRRGLDGDAMLTLATSLP
jgi:tagaturonate reductase